MEEDAKRRAIRERDACPIPPGTEPPRRRGRPVEILLNFYDDFLRNWKIVLSVLTAASLVLAYSLLTVPPPPISLPGEPDAWSRHIPEPTYYIWFIEAVWEPKFENQIVHDGDLILEGDDVLIVENSTYILNGELLVRDNARLVLRNAELYVKEKRSWIPTDLLPSPFVVVFNDTATLEAYNSSIAYPVGGWLDIGFLQFSDAAIDSSDFSRAFIYGDDHSKLKITNSEVERLIITKDSICEIVNSEISGISCVSCYHGQLRGHFLLGVWDSCRVDAWNSTVKNVSFEFENCTSATVSSDFHRYHKFWNSYINFSVDGSVFNLTLHDTNITGSSYLTLIEGFLRVQNIDGLYSIRVFNGTLQVSNCSFSGLGCGVGSRAEVEDSVFQRLFLMDDAQGLVSRSKMDRLLLEDFKGDAVFDNVLINEVYGCEGCECFISGRITFGENASTSEIRWGREREVVTRGFEVITQREGWVLPHVELNLYDKDETPIWRGETGKDGKANFNISFCRFWPLYEPYKYVSNQDDIWRLEAIKGEANYNISVGFLSDTPIVFTFPSLPKQPFWTQNWFLAALSASTIVLVFVAYLRKSLTARTRRVE